MTMHPSHQNLPVDLASIMVRWNLRDENEPFEISTVEGGVSSNVWYIRTRSGREMIAKHPLARLNVEQEWLADQRRSDFEAMFLRDMEACMPESVASVLAHDGDSHTLFLEYFPGHAYRNWREEILAGCVHERTGAAVGSILSRVHRLFACDAEAKKRYDARDILVGTRIDPYFDAVAKRHPGLVRKIGELKKRVLEADAVVIHGDVSPKNILVGEDRTILLDAECACIGDPAFDPAFLLAQLLLKALVVVDKEQEIMAACDGFAASYFEGVNWEDRAALERRVIEYLGLFLLARIDGKVPVPYIHDGFVKTLARDFGTQLIDLEGGTLTGVLSYWSMMIQENFGKLARIKLCNS